MFAFISNSDYEELTLIIVAPFQWIIREAGPLKMAMFEENILVNKDEGECPIGPRATSCAELLTSPLSV